MTITNRSNLVSLLEQYGDIKQSKDTLYEFLENDYGEIKQEQINILENHWKFVSNSIAYYNRTGSPCEKKDAEFVLLSTPLQNLIYTNDTASFLGQRTKGMEGFRLIFVGMHKKGIAKIEEICDSTKKQYAFEESLYDSLLIKDGWNSLPNYKILNTLLRITEARIEKVENESYLLRNEAGDILYNTGLINLYGKDILIIRKKDGEREIVTSKTQIIKSGFEKSAVLPVKFYEHPEELLFNGTEEDFDLENITNIRHIIRDRIDRFPKNMQDCSEDELARMIRTSVEFDLKMIARNPYWSAPFYNIKENEIQHLLPLFRGSVSEKPILAMVIGKGPYFYEVRTVLGLEEAYANAACLATPPSAWLNS